jgi:MoaA/NifB/PqqE/SkfB family radical SAM enzyme
LKKLTLIKQHEQVLQLTWFINNICTNHCDYCPPVLHTGANHNYDWAHARSFLTRLMDRHKKINCILLGGEPTVSPFLNEAIDMLHSRGHTVSLTSNGVRSVEYWKTIAPKVNNVSLSYHPSYGIENFFDKVNEIAKHTVIGVRIMFDSRHWDKTFDFYNQCLKVPNLRVEAIRILPEIAGGHTIGADYTPEQLAWLSATSSRQANHNHRHEIKKQNPSWKSLYTGSYFYYDDGSVDQHGDANHLISSEQSFFNGWACSIGVESLYINFDGQVRKGNCRQGPTLFHLDDHVNHPLPTDGEICTMGRCTCPTDILVSKFPVARNSITKSIPVIPLVKQ